MKDKYPLISIIALNYNQKEVTCEFLQSLHLLKYPNFEVVVVDNNSTINPVKDFKEAFPEVNVILSEKNLGFTGGNNLGIKNSKGDYYFIVNNDTEVTPDLLDKLLEPFMSDETIAMVSPKIKFYEQPDIIQYAGFHLINPLTGQNGAVGSKEVDNGQHDTPGFTNYAHGAAMLVSKKAVDQVGMLPDQFFIYYEELDWSSQMTRAGFKIYYQASATIYHKESITMGKESSVKAYYHTRNRILFMRRNYAGWQLATFYAFLVTAVIPKALLKYTITFRTEHLKSLIRAIRWHLSSKNIHNNIV